MTEDDLPAVEGWLGLPHVARWWTPDAAPELEADKYRRRINGTSARPTVMLTVDWAGDPIGWCQWYRWADHPAEAATMGAREGEAGIDYAIGDPSRIGRGAGAMLIAALVAVASHRQPGAGVLTAPDAANTPPRRVLEKNGFHLVAVRPVATEPTGAPMAIYRLPSVVCPGFARRPAPQ
jgi:RimJ/RimL family protein N-acetyltransferase